MEIESMSSLELKIKLREAGISIMPSDRAGLEKLYKESFGDFTVTGGMIARDKECENNDFNSTHTEAEKVEKPVKTPLDTSGEKEKNYEDSKMKVVFIPVLPDEKEDKTKHKRKSVIDKKTVNVFPSETDVVVPAKTEEKAKDTENDVSINTIVGQLLRAEKYKFVDTRLLVEIATDVCGILKAKTN